MALNALHPSCENFVGQTIHAHPISGWGWGRSDEDASGPIEVPPPFSLRVVRLTYHQGVLNGFMGKVEATNHLFEGLWAVTYARFVGNHDLISSMATMDILLGSDEPFLGTISDEPELEEYFRKKGREPWYPLWRLNGSPQFGGHVELATSREIHKVLQEKEATS